MSIAAGSSTANQGGKRGADWGAGPVGNGFAIESGANLAPVWSYVKSKGLFGGVQVNGQILIERNDENACVLFATLASDRADFSFADDLTASWSLLPRSLTAKSDLPTGAKACTRRFALPKVLSFSPLRPRLANLVHSPQAKTTAPPSSPSAPLPPTRPSPPAVSLPKNSIPTT